MTVLETEKVRGGPKDRRVSGRGGTSRIGSHGVPSDERESQQSQQRAVSGRHRRDRIAPEAGGGRNATMLRKEKTSSSSGPTGSSNNNSSRKRRSAKSNRRKLKVDSSFDSDKQDGVATPQTASSTPAAPIVRDESDLRSPGAQKTPMAGKAKIRMASEDAPVPDLITQTDQYGRATTPRTSSAIEKARSHPNTTSSKSKLHVGREQGKKEGHGEERMEEIDVCTDSFMDSIRIMCCCIMPDENSSSQQSMKQHINGTVPSCEEEEPEAELEHPKLLPPVHVDDKGKKCLVLDLDETLVHSSFRAVAGADFVIPVQIEDVVHFVYVLKRPGVDEFLIEMAKHYEIVVYTASLNKYADPLLDLLDPKKTIRSRLFRESCVYYEGNYVKDLSLLDRDLSQTIIVDNSPSSYSFHPENAIDCSSFIDDPEDRELDQIAAFLAGVRDVRDVRGLCHQWREWPEGKIAEDQ